MSNITRKLIQPESILIEKTALDLACVFYEAGRSSGLTSKHKDARAFARANVTTFIPKAVDLLMDIMGNPSTSKEMKDAIYDAMLERTNNVELTQLGIPEFENSMAKEFVSDKVVVPKPIIANTISIEDALRQNNLLERRSDGKEN